MQNKFKKIRNLFPNSLALDNLTIKSRLQTMFLAVSLGSVLVVSGISWYQGRGTLTNKIADQLKSVRTVKAEKFELFWENLYNQLEIIAADSNVIEAMVELNGGFRGLERSSVNPEWDKPLETYYTKEFFPRLKQNSPTLELQYDSYRPTGQAARYLQYYYIADNPNPVGEKDKLLDAGDGSEYNKFHTKHQEFFRKIINKYGYYDLFLINHKTGDMIYSVFKETDYATNLLKGPYSQSGLGDVVREVLANPAKGSIQVVDFKFYRPSYEAPAAFVGTPIYSGSNMIGILAVQIPIDKINRILSQSNDWQGSGLGQTGEAYLVGADSLMRSVSRFWVENPKKYKNLVRSQGTSPKTLQMMESLNTTIALQKIQSPVAQIALGGQEGTKVTRNYLGKEVLSSYANLDLQGLNWVILAEMELGEAYSPLYSLQRNLLIAGVIFLLITSYLAALVAKLFTEPLGNLIASATKIGNGEIDIEVPVKSKDEFGQLAAGFNEIINSLRQNKDELESQKQENKALLQNILPSTIAERRKKGESLIADSLKQVTILNASVIGILEWGKRKSPAQVTELLTRLFDEFDATGEGFGMERQQTVGTNYMAVCGLTQAIFDHSKRSVDCALAMFKTVENINNDYNSALALRIGIHTGAVTAGLVGTQKFRYNIWGEAISIAAQLPKYAELNRMLITQNVYQSVADAYTFMPQTTVTVDNLPEVETWTLVTFIKMEKTQVELVQSSLTKVQLVAEETGELFYQRLFELEPSFRALFGVDIHVQQRKFMTTLAVAVEGLRNPQNIIPIVQDLGRRHAGYGVKDEYYEIVGEALIWSLKQSLGNDFTLPVRRAWEEALLFLSEIMKQSVAEKELEKSVIS